MVFNYLPRNIAKLFILLSMSLCLVLTGCDTLSLFSAPLQKRGITGFFQDNMIRVNLNNIMAEKKELDPVEMMAHKGKVFLMGVVKTEAIKAMAYTQAKKVKGIRAIFNHIEVAPYSIASLGTDLMASEKLRAALLFDTRIASRNYHIRVVNRIAYILGTAQSKIERDAVLKHAESHAIRSVICNIDISESNSTPH